MGYRLGTSDEIARRQELFFDVCSQKMMAGAEEDDFDRELNFNSPTTATPPQTVRYSLPYNFLHSTTLLSNSIYKLKKLNDNFSK